MASSTVSFGQQGRGVCGGDDNGGGKGGNKGSSNKSSNSNGFQTLGLSDGVYRGIIRMGFRTPTPVQRKSLPIILSGVDTVVMARTGSGKTAAFLIPILEKLVTTTTSSNDTRSGGGGGCRALILSPTRELSLQTLRVMTKLSHFVKDQIRNIIGIHGGESMEKQFNALASKPDVIIATPGRLAHHLTEIPDFHLKGCHICILDEADRLIEMGFAQQIRQIASTLPVDSCQKVMLSATMPKVLVEFTKNGFCVDPHVCRLDNEVNVSDELRIAFITCRSHDKDAALLHVIHHIQQQNEKENKNQQEDNQEEKEEAYSSNSKKDRKKKKKNKNKNNHNNLGLTLIFAATRHHVEYITTLLNSSSYAGNSQDIATMVYGTLDQEARKHNISAFRSGQKPILVVTDVAARGIDIPLIDHVIHYAFPSNAKLFVHRSGRAARAGRIGYCWSLVEPDELPYMMDLHLFLGRKPSTGIITKTNEEGEDYENENNNDDRDKSNSNNDNDNGDNDFSYTLREMTPDMVHYGSVPESVLVEEVENVRRIMDAELTGSNDAQALKSLIKTCNNAMKQYRRSRPEASREGVRRAKAILEGDKLENGQRVGGGSIPSHPLLRGMELDDYERRKQRGIVVDGGLNDLQNIKKREDFLLALSNFRPHETVFEAFATGGGKETSVVSHIDKGRTTSSKSNTKTDRNERTSAALSAMKSMRRQMKIARDKGSTLVIAGSTNAQVLNGDDKDDDNNNTEIDDNDDSNITSSLPGAPQPVTIKETKKRLSKAERKRLKKGGGGNNNGSIETSSNDAGHHQQQSKSKNKRGTDFRDETYFIDNNYSNLDRQREAAMQPSATTSQKGAMGTALRIEETMMDIVGDENTDLIKNQRMMRWDKQKRKYVQTTVGAELSGDSKSKKLRLESGQLVKSDKMKLGEMYERWQKKTNRSVGRVGVFDDDDDDAPEYDDVVDPTTSTKRGGGGGKNNKRGGVAGGKKNKDDYRGKTAQEIKKDREKKQDMNLKNMKKSDRRRVEHGKGSNRCDNKNANAKGHQGKKGKSGRWKTNTKGRR